MLKHKLSSGKTLEFYQTIREMPIQRWNRFLSLMIQDSELGPDIQSASHKISLAVQMVNEKKFEDFSTLMRNFQLQLYYTFQGISPKAHALAQRIHSIDGVIIQGEIPKEIIDEISNDPEITVGLLEGLTEDFRKK